MNPEPKILTAEEFRKRYPKPADVGERREGREALTPDEFRRRYSGGLTKEDEIGYFTELGHRLLRGGSQVYGSVVGTLPRMVGEVFDAKALEKFGRFEEAWADAYARSLKVSPEYEKPVWEHPELLKDPKYLTLKAAEVFPSFAASLVPALGTARAVQLLGYSRKLAAFLGALAGGAGGLVSIGSVGKEGTHRKPQVLEGS